MESYPIKITFSVLALMVLVMGYVLWYLLLAASLSNADNWFGNAYLASALFVFLAIASPILGLVGVVRGERPLYIPYTVLIITLIHLIYSM
jgi:hypothetical protein